MALEWRIIQVWEVLDQTVEISQGLGKCPSVFQAKVLAIDVCAKSIVENGIIGVSIYILSDSQAALKALQRPIQVSKIVEKCRNSLQVLALHNNLTTGILIINEI
jgi:hypothetical protein